MWSPAGGQAETYLDKGDYVGPDEEISVNHLHLMNKDVLQELFPETTIVSLTITYNT